MMEMYYPLTLTSAASTATAWRMQAPFRCTLLDADGSSSAAIARTFTVSHGGNSLGVMTFTAASQDGTWAANASYGSTVMDAGDELTITQSSTATAAEVILTLELDPYARTATDFA